MVVIEHVLGNAFDRANMEGLNHDLIQITYYLQAHSFYETLQMRYVPAQDIKEHSEVSIMTSCFSFFKRNIANTLIDLLTEVERGTTFTLTLA